MFVLDASVWVSAILPTDAWHAISAPFVEHTVASGTTMVVPTLFLAEVCAAVARQTTPADGLLVREQLLAIDLFVWISVDDALARIAAELGATHQIRGADSIYVALAREFDLPLVSLDRNHLERTEGVIGVYRPDTLPQ
jgi:predicted nucleic acid-binding protein